jgi:hypothetical protein
LTTRQDYVLLRGALCFALAFSSFALALCLERLAALASTLANHWFRQSSGLALSTTQSFEKAIASRARAAAAPGVTLFF